MSIELYGLDHLARAIAEREIILRMSVEKGRWFVVILDRNNPDDKIEDDYGNGTAMDDALKQSFHKWDRSRR